MITITVEENTGTVQIYTGNGKGKTTAALGMALRFLGHDKKVCIIQFMKDSDTYGEIKAIKQFSHVHIYSMGRDTFVNRENPDTRDVELAQEGVEKARECLMSDQYDLVILDELNVAVDFHLIELEQVIELIDEKPNGVELVITGRYAPQTLMDKADLVSEVSEVKHYFQQEINARLGTEY